MKHLIAIGLLVAAVVPAARAEDAAPNPRVALETSKGQIVVELFADKAPGSVKNFLGYVESGFFDDTIFHRVIPRFMVQGGGFTTDLKKKPTQPPIGNEADNGLSNLRGTLALARTPDPHSANAQFFINLVDNPHLDHKAKTATGWGYTVFGQVVTGMDVVDAIAEIETRRQGMFTSLPVETVTIEMASVLDSQD